MHLTSILELKEQPGAKASLSPIAELFLNGIATGKFVPGAYLNTAVMWGRNFVLLAPDGISFEEFLNIHLLDADLNILDSASIGMMYATGVVERLTLNEPNALEFSYFETERWRVTLFPSPRLRILWFSEPLGVWRRFSFHRHFRIERLPTA